MPLPRHVHDLSPVQVGADGLGHESVIERAARRLDLHVAVSAGRLGFVQDSLVGRGQGRIGEPGPGGRHPAREVDLGRGGPVIAEDWLGGGDARADPGRHRVAVPGVPDRVLHDVAQPHPAVPLEQQHPAAEGCGDTGGQQSVARDQVQIQGAERGQRGRTRRRSLAVQHEHAGASGPLVRVVADDRRLAAYPVHVRLDHLQHQPRRHGRVERGAPRLQHRHPGCGGQPVGGGDHAEGTRELGPGGERGTLRQHQHS